MLRNIRIALAAIFFVAVTLLFIDISGVAAQWFGWIAKLQLVPAVMALNLAVILFLALLTILFGRVYCSVICPLGVFQDIVSHCSSMRKGKKARFGWKKEYKWLRYTMLVLFVLACASGLPLLIAPYSAYGRMVSAFFGSGLGSPAVLVTGIVTLVVIVVFAWIGGRLYCNSVCPVGTVLGWLSKFAIFRPVIDSEKCKNCKMCERGCKSSCINIAEKKIDYSRCVGCMDCLDSCKFGALEYRYAYGKNSAEQTSADASRRTFMTVGAIALTSAALKAQEKKLDGGLAEIIDKTEPERKGLIVPFGAGSVKNFYDHCTACQLCVSECPNKVLRPSTDFGHFMKPKMSYEYGYCRPECTKCSQVCPAGAILPVTPVQKTAIRIGVAEVDYDLCVVNRDGVSCGNCSRHCPSGAIIMVSKTEDGVEKKLPSVMESRCIGCGACENLCPSRPISAIKVNGLGVHINEED